MQIATEFLAYEFNALSVGATGLRGWGGAIVWLLWVASNYQHDIKYIKITLDTRGRGWRRGRAMAGHMPHVEVKVFATCDQKTRAWSQYSRPNHIKSHARLHMNWYTIYYTIYDIGMTDCLTFLWTCWNLSSSWEHKDSNNKSSRLQEFPS